MPLYIYPDREPSAVLYAIGLVVRAGWRYRSELAPLYWTAGVVAAGAWLHAVHPAWWPVPATLAGSAVVTVLAWAMPGRSARRVRGRLAGWWMRRAGRRVLARWPVLARLARPGVRAWLLAVTACAGGWLTAATISGVTADPLPGLAVLAMGGLGARWWWSHDRRRLVRIRRVMDHFEDTADSAGLPGTTMVSARIGRYGWTARLKLRRGLHAGNATAAIPALESALGTRIGAVRVEPVPGDAAEVRLTVMETDPNAHPIPWPGIQLDRKSGSHAGARRSVADPVRVGLWEDGHPVRVSLLRRHVLVGGTTGSGKSGLLNVILAELSGCADVVLWGIDLKGGTELTPWSPCLARVERTKADATTVLADAVGELDRRAAFMADHGQREWRPAPAAPALVIVVDEFTELTQEARRHADSIARRGRAVAVTLLIATQRPTVKALGEGTAIRSQMDVRFGFRMRERKDVDLVFGQGAVSAGWDTTGLDAPGKFMLSAPGHDTPRRGRVYLITDVQVRDIATRHAQPHDRPQDRSQGGSTDDRADQPGRPDERAGAVGGLLIPTDGHGRDPAPDDPGGHEASAAAGGAGGESVSGPDVALWAVLWEASDDGVSIAGLVTATGRSRSWVYARLHDHQRAGRVTRTRQGQWRATPPPTAGNQPV